MTALGFCGDRSTLNLQEGVGTGTVTTYYNGYLRVIESTPNLLCNNEQDLYTVSSSNQGNKALSYPVGLITADEVMLAGTGGGFFNGSFNHQKLAMDTYLTNGYTFWLISPAGMYNPYNQTNFLAYGFNLNASGSIDDNTLQTEYTLRPVINLRKDVTITGEGTKENPYKIS